MVDSPISPSGRSLVNFPGPLPWALALTETVPPTRAYEGSRQTEDPAAAAQEIQRRREEIGFSYVVVGAAFADALAPVVAELAGR